MELRPEFYLYIYFRMRPTNYLSLFPVSGYEIHLFILYYINSFQYEGLVGKIITSPPHSCSLLQENCHMLEAIFL